MKIMSARKPLAAAVAIASTLCVPTVVAQGDSPAMALEEIVVTARRRAENLQDVPIAVSAITGDELNMRGLLDITEVAQSVPSLTLEPTRATNTTLTAFIRGVGQQDPLAGFEQGVAIYVDDVYFARPQAALLDIYDVERIEVLRGPQGTLYGRNAVGGAIKYVTRRLSDEPEFRVRGALGSYNQQDLVGTASVPLGDKVRVGGTVASLTRDGFGDNLTLGTEQYDKDIFAYRLSAEFLPTDDLLIRVSYDNTQDDSSPVAGFRPFPGAVSGAPVLNDIYDSLAGAAGNPSTAGIGGRNEIEAEGFSVAVDWNLNDAITLRSITAQREDYTESVIDFDSLAVDDFDAPVIYDNEQFSQEFQLLYTSDRLNAVVGAYYLDAEASNDFDVVLGQLADPAVTAYTGGTIETEAWSVFADFTYNLTDRLALSVGGRYTEDTRTAAVFRGTYLGVGSPFLGNDSAFLLSVSSDYDAEKTFDDFSPRVNVSYVLNDDATVYAGYSRGWKAGTFDPRGANFVNPSVVDGVDEEVLDSYELGLKAIWMDGRMLTNIAVFYSDYTDIQIPGSLGLDTDGDGVNDDFVGTLENAGEAEISGIEFEGNLLITEGLSAQLSFSLLDAKYTEFLVDGVDVSSDRFIQNTPEEMGYLGLTYNTDLFGGTMTLNGNLSYKGDITQFEVAAPIIDQEAYTIYNASVFWTSGSESWLVGLHGRNLGDEEIRNSGYCFGSGGCPSTLGLEDNTTIFFAAPLTVTASVEYRF